MNEVHSVLVTATIDVAAEQRYTDPQVIDRAEHDSSAGPLSEIPSLGLD